MFKFKVLTKIVQETKWDILSEISSIFDPMDLIAPVICENQITDSRVTEKRVRLEQ